MAGGLAAGLTVRPVSTVREREREREGRATTNNWSSQPAAPFASHRTASCSLTNIVVGNDISDSVVLSVREGRGGAGEGHIEPS